MAYFKDLTPYTYGANHSNIRPDLPAVNIGWLTFKEEYSEGPVTPAQLERIESLLKCQLVNLYRGWHSCDLCTITIANGFLMKDRTGNGEIRVVGKDKVYVAPQLLLHYITEHNYQPPAEFLETIDAYSEVYRQVREEADSNRSVGGGEQRSVTCVP